MSNGKSSYSIATEVMFDLNEYGPEQAYGCIVNKSINKEGIRVYDIMTSSGIVHTEIPGHCMSVIQNVFDC